MRQTDCVFSIPVGGVRWPKYAPRLPGGSVVVAAELSPFCPLATAYQLNSFNKYEMNVLRNRNCSAYSLSTSHELGGLAGTGASGGRT